MIIVVILIISAMAAQYSHRAIVDRRQVRTELRERQTRELAMAGIRRAQHQYQLDPAWTGETWTPSIRTDSETKQSEVVISIDGQMATVVARYPVNDRMPVQITQQIQLEQP